MQTSLPDLPFTNHGRAELRPCGTHSTTPSPRRRLRTDLETLTPWTSFPNEIHQAIQTATAQAHLPSTPFTIQVLTGNTYVENEERIRAHATFALHMAVENVLAKLGVDGEFILAGGGSPVAVVGDPDFSWVNTTGLATSWQPKLVVEYKSWWAEDLMYVVEAFNGTRDDALSKRSLEALHQIYAYMTFNNNKFGILTNWQRALFLCRGEPSNGKSLQYYLIELGGPQGQMSMLKAWVGMVLLSEAGWFYAPPTTTGLSNFGTSKAAWKEQARAFQNARGYHMSPNRGTYKCLTLDFRLCRFKIGSARHASMACVVDAEFLAPAVGKPNLQVVCKVFDVLRYHDAADMLDSEVRAYAALKHLQGNVIPKLYGFYKVWGILRLIAMEPVGSPVPEDEPIDETLRTRMKTTLQHIHAAGFIHGDIARRNFCRKPNGVVSLVDLERCRPFKNQSELDGEMNEVDRL